MLLHPIRSSGQCSQWSTSFRTSSRTAANRSLWQISPACRKAQKTSRFAFASSNETRMHFSKKLSSHNGNKDVKDSATTILRLDIKQRKSGTWLPKWQSLTITKDDSSDPDNDRLKAVAHRNQPPPNDDSIEGEGSIGITKYLLSPQATLAVFLPKGYPESVTPNYWAFAKWQFFHNIAGSVTAVISTQSLLFAMGLGAGSIPMAAALNWIIKDGLGQLGGVVYASFVSDKFDSEPKRYRFQASVAMQGANVLELLTPLWPGYFLIIASISNIGKNMAWLASSATRAQMNKTFALRDNLGDITGKSGSQTTAAGLVGTGLGVVIAALMSHVSEDPTVLPLIPMCLTFLPFSVFNIYSNYRSSHYVTTPSLNVPRAETVFHKVLHELALNNEASYGEKSTDTRLYQELERLVPTPKEVAHKEVFVRSYHSPFSIAIDIEPAVSDFTGTGDAVKPLERALRQMDFIQREQYYIMIDGSAIGAQTQHNKKVVLWFDKEAQGSDLIQGFYHACAIRAILENKNCQNRKSGHSLSGATLDDSKEGQEWSQAVARAHKQTIETVPELVAVMNRKGWDTTSLFLTDGDWSRIHIQ